MAGRGHGWRSGRRLNALLGGLAVATVVSGAIGLAVDGTGGPDKSRQTLTEGAPAFPTTSTTAPSSGVPGSTTTVLAPEIAATNKQLLTHLLVLGDLPAGWHGGATRVNNLGLDFDPEAPSDPSCFEAADSDTDDVAEADVDFADGSSHDPQLFESIYAEPGGITEVYSEVIRALGSCGQVTFTDKDVSYTGTIQPLPLPAFGQRSTVFQVLFSAPAGGVVSVGLMGAFVIKGNDLVTVTLAGTGPQSPQQLESFLQKALPKVPQYVGDP